MPQAQIEINAVVGSDTDLPINTLVQLSNNDIGGELTYEWSILDQPTGAADLLSNPAIENPTFTPKKEGTYLIQLIVNKTLPDEDTDTVVAAVKLLKSRERVPAAGEQTEASTSRGWAVDVNQFLRAIDDALAAPVTIVGVNADVSPMAKGTVIRVTSGQTIKSGLPGQEIVPGFVPAPATVGTNVDELLAVVESGVDGANPVPVGALLRARALGRIASIALGAGSVGDRVFVSDSATISTTPGTNQRQIGSIMSISGVNRDIWIEGTQGGEGAPVDRAYVVYGAVGTLFNGKRIDGLNATGCINGIPYTFRSGDATTVALVAKRFSIGSTADVFQAHDEVGTVTARISKDGNIIGQPLTGIGVQGSGVGTSEGVKGIGGSTSGGNGVVGQGGSGGGYGVRGDGTGGFSGVAGFAAGGSDGRGVTGVGDGAGAGVVGQGASGGTGIGVNGLGGTINGQGVKGTGYGTGVGVRGFGGSSASGVHGTGGGSESGVKGEGSVSGGVGVEGNGTGTSTGVVGTATGSAGNGVKGVGASGNSGVRGEGGPVGGSGVAGFGGINGRGADFLGNGTASGVVSVGGATNGTGVEGIAQGSGVGIEGQGTSPVALTPQGGTGVVGRGGSTNGHGVHGEGKALGVGVRGNSVAGAGVYGSSASNVGVQGESTNSSGVLGLSTNSYGVDARGSTAGTPPTGALRIRPQTAQPSSGGKGDVYVLNQDGRPAMHNGVVWNPHVMQAHVGTTFPDTRYGGTPGDQTPFLNSFTVPANTLGVGVTMRIVAVLQSDNPTPDDVFVKLLFGGTQIALTPTVANAVQGAKFRLEAMITIASIGATGSYHYSGVGMASNTAVPSLFHDVKQSPLNAVVINTTVNQAVQVVANFSLPGNSTETQISLGQLIVDMTTAK